MQQADVIEAFSNYLLHNRGRSPITAHKYCAYLDRLHKSIDKSILLATRDEIEFFSGVESHKAGLSPRSRRQMVAALRGFFAWAKKSSLITSNPAVDLPYPRAGQKLPVPLSLKYAERILMAPDLDTFIGVRDAAIIALLIGCGPRVSGLCALNEGDLVFDQINGVDWLVIRLREKGKKERLVPVPHEARLLLLAYLGHPELAEIDRLLPDGDRVLFVGTRNRSIPQHEYFGEARRLHSRSVNDLIERYAERAGVPRSMAHPHAFRHLYGTELAEHDAQAYQLQTLMGHADERSSRIYVHLATRTLAKLVDRANPLGSINTPASGLLRSRAKKPA